MKKRSLFAAVAMLIVSAVVLTSATYAWFSTGATAANVEIAKATVDQGDIGAVLVKADTASTWGTTVTAAALFGSNIASKEVVPVDIRADSALNMANIYNCPFDGVNYTPGAGSVNNIIHYKWNVKSVKYTQGQNIEIPVNFGNNGSSVLYGAIYVNSETPQFYVFGPKGYNAFTAADFTAVEAGTANSIIDSGDTFSSGATAATKLAAISTSTPSGGVITVPARDDYYTIECWIWCEGQNEDCHGSASIAATDNAGFTFTNIALS